MFLTIDSFMHFNTMICYFYSELYIFLISLYPQSNTHISRPDVNEVQFVTRGNVRPTNLFSLSKSPLTVSEHMQQPGVNRQTNQEGPQVILHSSGSIPNSYIPCQLEAALNLHQQINFSTKRNIVVDILLL